MHVKISDGVLERFADGQFEYSGPDNEGNCITYCGKVRRAFVQEEKMVVIFWWLAQQDQNGRWHKLDISPPFHIITITCAEFSIMDGRLSYKFSFECERGTFRPYGDKMFVDPSALTLQKAS